MTSADTPWFETAFEAGYLDVYAHRDQASANREIAGLLERGLAPEGARVLDLACGAGRHSLALLSAGCDVVGLDLSRDLLERAAELRSGASGTAKGELTGRLIRGDVRSLPFKEDAFGAVKEVHCRRGT